MSMKRKASRSGVYHVMVRGINKESIFVEVHMKKIVRSLIRKYLKKYRIILFCYCIMRNHVHLLLRCEDLSELSEFMAGWEADYAKYYNAELERSGYVFQGRYKSEMVDDEEYFWTCLRYIHLNPVKAGFCRSFDAYEFSSAWEYLHGEKIILNDRSTEFYKKRFSDMEQFMRFHNAGYRKTCIMDTEEDESVYEKEIIAEIYRKITGKTNGQEEPAANNKTILKKRFLKELQESGGLSRYRAEKIFEKYPGLF